MIATVGKYKLEIRSWNSLSRKQLLNFSMFSASDINPISLKTKLFCIFFKLKPIRKKAIILEGTEHFWFIRQFKLMLISVTDINILSEAILNTFYTRNEEGNYCLDVTLTKNILSPFRIGFRKYYGPNDALTNITFREFIFSDTFYVQYSETKVVKSLDNLIAVLFRPHKSFLFIRKRLNGYNGDPRISFNDNRISFLAKRVSRLPFEYKTSILLFYIGCRRHIANEFEHVFTSTSGSVTINSDTFKMYLHLTDLLAKGNPLDKELIRDTQLYDVLDTLNNLIINNKTK